MKWGVAKIVTSRDLPTEDLFALQLQCVYTHEIDDQLDSLNSKLCQAQSYLSSTTRFEAL